MKKACNFSDAVVRNQKKVLAHTPSAMSHHNPKQIIEGRKFTLKFGASSKYKLNYVICLRHLSIVAPHPNDVFCAP